MKALFLSVTAGQGHHQAGKAMMGALTKAGWQCEMIDTYEFISPVIKESISRGYLISTKYSPTLYGKVYRMAEKIDKNELTAHVTRFSNQILTKKLIQHIDAFDPDVIICTHVFSAQVVSDAKRKGHLQNIKTIAIVTDFTVHPFWEYTDIDYYITPHELLNIQMEKKGLPISKVVPIGIPIAEKFKNSLPQQEARKILKIEDKPTLFIISGSMGYGNMFKLIEKIDLLKTDFQILCVCGNNKRLYKTINETISQKKIYNYAFVDNVNIMMDASDCVITKPGGLTTSEALAKRLPLILTKPIPGQEDRNTEFLVNNGVAVKASKTFPIDEAIFEIMNSAKKRELMKNAAEYIGKPNSTSDFVKLVHSIC